jgi:uncharacterized protein (DUF2236 family)
MGKHELFDSQVGGAAEIATLSDDGYFPKDFSVLRKVHDNRIVGLLYGPRALLIGALDPLNYIGTSNHTKAKQVPFERLKRTAEMFEKVFFGTQAEADAVVNKVNKLHSRVAGSLKQDVGPYTAGTAYAAFDPEMMLWTIACMADSAITLYETTVKKLDESQRDGFWQDYIRVGELFGMPTDVAPQSYAEFRKYFDERLASEQMHLTESAKFMGKQVCFHPPVPGAAKPVLEVSNLLILGTLPENVRELYGLPWTHKQEAAFHIATLALKNSRILLPEVIANGTNMHAFDMVAHTEARLRKQGTAISMPADPIYLTPHIY